jgi:disulfide oxidoreductase YuzD
MPTINPKRPNVVFRKRYIDMSAQTRAKRKRLIDMISLALIYPLLKNDLGL